MRLLNLTLFLAVACLAGTSTTADAQTINACVMKNGLMKVVDNESDCGPQETPITLGQPQPAAETTRVFDGNGRDIGAFVDARPAFISERRVPILWRILLAESRVIGLIDTESGMLRNSTPIYFSELNCEGRGYVPLYWSNTLISDPRPDRSWLIGSTTEYLPLLTDVDSILHADGFCEPSFRIAGVPAVIPVEEFKQEPKLTFPLPRPLWIGSSSSDSP